MARKQKVMKGKGHRKPEIPLRVERRAAWLARAELELLLTCLEQCGHGTGSVHFLLRKVLEEFDDAALKVQEMVTTLKASAWWDDPEAWAREDRDRGLEKYKKADKRKKLKCIAHESAKVIRQLLKEEGVIK